MSWTEVTEAAEENPVVLVPIGAIEQHGPHLPIHEDSIVADWVAHRIADELDVLVAPPLNYGHSPTFRGYPGNLSLSAETLRTAIYEIIATLVDSGFRRIVLVNNNGGNVGPASSAAVDARRDLGVLIGHVYPWSLGYSLMRDVYDDASKVYGHGAEPEHSAMLAIFPDQVQSDRVTTGGMRELNGWQPASYTEAHIPGQPITGTVFWDFSEVSASGVTGDVHAANPEIGKVWIDRVVGFCVAFVREYDKNTRDTSSARAS